MRIIVMILALVLFANVNILVAQEVCETKEETFEDLNSITKCTIDKSEKTDTSGKKLKNYL